MTFVVELMLKIDEYYASPEWAAAIAKQFGPKPQQAPGITSVPPEDFVKAGEAIRAEKVRGLEDGPGLEAKSLPPARERWICPFLDEDLMGVDVK